MTAKQQALAAQAPVASANALLSGAARRVDEVIAAAGCALALNSDAKPQAA